MGEEWYEVHFRHPGDEMTAPMDWSGGPNRRATIEEARATAISFLRDSPGWMARITRVVRAEVVEVIGSSLATSRPADAAGGEG